MSRPITISDDTILEAARALFTEKGPRATTAEIAARAGVSEGIVFKRFGSKAALHKAAMSSGMVAGSIQRETRAQAPLRTQDDFARFIRWQASVLRDVVPVVIMAWSSRSHADELPADSERPPGGAAHRHPHRGGHAPGGDGRRAPRPAQRGGCCTYPHRVGVVLRLPRPRVQPGARRGRRGHVRGGARASGLRRRGPCARSASQNQGSSVKRAVGVRSGHDDRIRGHRHPRDRGERSPVQPRPVSSEASGSRWASSLRLPDEITSDGVDL